MTAPAVQAEALKYLRDSAVDNGWCITDGVHAGFKATKDNVKVYVGVQEDGTVIAARDIPEFASIIQTVEFWLEGAL